MTPVPNQMQDFDAPAFLRDYWQKKPLLIRSPWNRWSNPIEPDELAGLACEYHVESRLVTQDDRGWALEQGPLSESRFGKRRREPWTLLVQAVDHHVASVADLLQSFRFIPNWRVDDVMVSYAVDGGGVGPHFDHYDVFLVQGLGHRRWELGGLCDDATELLPHDDLRLLADFEATQEWILGPGDILYVPPRIAHCGVAVGDDCMTYSIGFRAPSRAELVENWADSLLGEMGDDDRFTDPDLSPQDNPGEIRPRAIADLHSMITEAVLDQRSFAQWFGQYSTSPKNPDIDWRPEEPVSADDVRQGLSQGLALMRNPASRFAFIRGEGSSLSLFVDGRCYACTDDAAAFAERISAADRLDVAPESAAATLDLIVELMNEGCIAFAFKE